MLAVSPAFSPAASPFSPPAFRAALALLVVAALAGSQLFFLVFFGLWPLPLPCLFFDWRDWGGEGSPGHIESETELLYEDGDQDGDDRVDFGEGIKKLDVETMDAAYRDIRASQDIEEGPCDAVGDLMAAAASPTVLAGFTVDEDEFEEMAFAGDPIDPNRSEATSAEATSASSEPAKRLSRRERKAAAPGDLAVAAATLPEPMTRGVWPAPEEFDLSDHGPLTAVLVPRA